MIKSIKYRVKDKNTCTILNQMARDTNFVWNVLNSASRKKWKESRKIFHKFDPYYNEIIKGSSELLTINYRTIQFIRDHFHKNLRKEMKQLRYRGKKSPKWIPFKANNSMIKNGVFRYKKNNFRFWDSFKINGIVKSGSFTQDCTGKWWVSISYESSEVKKSEGISQIGIDLGLKNAATCSNGDVLNVSDLDSIDRRINKLQRARRFTLVNTLYTKKSNIKNDRFNKFALNLVKTNNLIAIGNIKGFTKGTVAKSRHQNSWGILKTKLEFKSLEYDVQLCEVSEYLTTQTCNICGAIEGPKGIKELSVRSWICSCGAELNRDINAAINILDRAKCLAS